MYKSTLHKDCRAFHGNGSRPEATPVQRQPPDHCHPFLEMDLRHHLDYLGASYVDSQHCDLRVRAYSSIVTILQLDLHTVVSTHISPDFMDTGVVDLRCLIY